MKFKIKYTYNFMPIPILCSIKIKSMCQKGNVIVLILSEVIKLFEKKRKIVAIVVAFAKRTFANRKRKRN